MQIEEVIRKPIRPKAAMGPEEARIHALQQGLERARVKVDQSREMVKQERERQRKQRDSQRKAAAIGSLVRKS